MKKVFALIFMFLLSFCSSCASEPELPQETELYVLPVLGDFYISEPLNPSDIPILFLSSSDDPVIEDLLNHTVQMSFEGMSEQNVVSWKYDLSDSDALKPNIALLSLNIDLSIPEQENPLELKTLNVKTEEQNYSFDIGSICIHPHEPYSQDILTLNGHMGASSNAGLKLYDATYTNHTKEPVFITGLDMGAFAEYNYEITIEKENLTIMGEYYQSIPVPGTKVTIDTPENFSYRLEPEETITITIDFHQTPYDSNGYQVFLIGPLFRARHLEENFELFTPYASNGNLLSAEEIEVLFNEHVVIS